MVLRCLQVWFPWPNESAVRQDDYDEDSVSLGHGTPLKDGPGGA